MCCQLSRARPETVLLHSLWGYDERVLPKLAKTIAELKRLQVARIVIIGPPPQWRGGLPQAIYEYYRKYRLQGLLPRRSYFHIYENLAGFDRNLGVTVRSLGAEYISAWDAMCNEEGCLTRVGNSPMDITVFDFGHLTTAGSRYLAAKIAPRLFPGGGVPAQ
jgi:hypothetical protein